MAFCLRFTIAASWKRCSGFTVSIAAGSRRITFVCPNWAWNYDDTYDRRWQAMVSATSKTWNNYLGKRSLSHRSSEALWLNNQCTAIWAILQIRSLNSQAQQGPKSLSGRSCDGVSKWKQLDNDLDALVQHGVVPSVPVFKSLLRECSKSKALAQAKRAHAHLVKHGLASSRILGEYLVCTFVTCGSLEDALEVFQRLSDRTVISWTAIISGYANCGQGHEALRMYQYMQREGVEPDKFTFVSLIKACGSIADLKRIHADVLKRRCESDFFVSSSLVDMYARCGSIVDAQNVFDRLSQRNVVSWNAMLAAYIQLGQADQSLQLYERMLEEGISPDARTFVKVLQACGMCAEKEDNTMVDGQLTKMEILERAKSIHADMQWKGYDSDVFVGSSLVSMYRKCGSIVDAQKVFDGLIQQQDVVSWNSMLTAYVQQSEGEKALQLYERMMEEGVSPNDRTLVTALQACSLLAEKEEHVVVNGELLKLKSLEKGKALHVDSRRRDCEFDVFIGNTLVSTYGKCGSIGDAENVFAGLVKRDAVSWNAMLAAYAQQGQAEKVLQLYERMLEEGVSRDDRTFLSALQACGMLAESEDYVFVNGRQTKVFSLERGKAIHVDAWSRGYKLDVFICNTLVSMYGKCGRIWDAENIFNGLSHRDVVSWNVMLTAYAQQGQAEKALQLYEDMLEQGMTPDDVTILCILQACSNTGSLHVCTQIHNHLVRNGNDSGLLLSSALIHTYGRCSSMAKAQSVFDALAHRDVVSWNALIAGYAREGNSYASLKCYSDMCLAGMQPNGVTFLSLLSACSHAGLVDEGFEYFESMSKHYGIAPGVDHYASMVDLLGRAGHFSMVQELLSTMPLQPNLSIWLCLLSACRKHGNIMLGKHAFDCAVQLQPNHAAAYVMMSHIYSHAGMWEEVHKVHVLEQRAGTWKEPGQCWIQPAQELHTFLVGDPNDKRNQPLYDLVGQISLELK